MCDTHEPPVDMREGMTAGDSVEGSSNSAMDLADTPRSIDDSQVGEETASEVDDPQLPYTDDISRGQLCAFVPGYFEYLSETNLTVRSIQRFMPGMKVAIATAALDFHVYNR